MNRVKDFCLDCQARGLTYHTIETYKGCVKLFLVMYPKPEKVTNDDLRTFLSMLQEKNLSGSSFKGYFAALSSYYDYLIFEGKANANIILPFRKRYLSRVKRQYGGDNSRQIPSVQDVRQILQEAEKRGSQEFLLIIMLAKLGIRRGELLGITVNNIDLGRGVIRLPGPAKRTFRRAVIDEELRAAIKKWLPERGKIAKVENLFISEHGRKMHKDEPGRIIADIAGSLGLHKPGGLMIEKLTPHCFRYFFTTQLYRAGLKVEYIKYLRGDARAETWEIYNDLEFDDIRAAYLRGIPSLLRFEQRLEVYQ